MSVVPSGTRDPGASGAVDAYTAAFRDQVVLDLALNNEERLTRQLEATRDPAVRAVLARIAEDEARHAALAWRFVAWAVRSGDIAVREAVARSFAQAVGRIESTVPEGDVDPALAAHGRLDAASLRAVARAAVTTIITPSMRALELEAAPAASA